ncbi:MAG TPA: DUF697 domain-containing protein, partial [Kiritimatiellae bacterium]|nr:DUF697 domain-containing protein [Kiritimatiellia bacterium]
MMFRELWYSMKRALVAAGLLATFLAAVELFRAFVFFHRLNHLLGFAFLAFVILLLFALGRVLLGPWLKQSRVLNPPELPPLQEAAFGELKRYCRYLLRYLERLRRNPNLDREARRRVEQGISDLAERLAAHPLRRDLARGIRVCEQEVLEPVLGGLRARAEKEVRDCVRDVMLGVALSPYHSLDLLLVITRIGRLMGRISAIFLSRPLPRDEWLVFRDTVRVVLAVNAFNLGRSVFREILSGAPLVGRSAYHLAEALGAGLFTSLAGHAAILRVAAYRGWNRDEAARALGAQVGSFARDLGKIFTTDMVSLFLRPTAGGEGQEDASLKRRLQDAVSSVLDSLAGLAQQLSPAAGAPAASGDAPPEEAAA